MIISNALKGNSKVEEHANTCESLGLVLILGSDQGVGRLVIVYPLKKFYAQ